MMIITFTLFQSLSVVLFSLFISTLCFAHFFLWQGASQVYDLHLEYLTSEPSMYLVLCRENAVKKLRDVLGPEDPQQARRQNQFYWRGIYGSDIVHNGLYGGSSVYSSCHCAQWVVWWVICLQLLSLCTVGCIMGHLFTALVIVHNGLYCGSSVYSSCQ